MKIYFVLLILYCKIALLQAFYTTKDDVKLLTPQKFISEVLNTDQLAVVEFYAPWCGHCQRLAPEWKKVASNLKGLVSVGAVDCDVDTNKALCGQYNIKGFPSIKVFAPNLKKNKNTGKMTKTSSDYQGPRNARAIADYLLTQQPSNVLFVKSNEKDVKSKKSISLEKFLEIQNETIPKALLFTDKLTTTPLYKALSVEFKNRILMGEVKKTEVNIVSQFGVQFFPTLVVLNPESGPVYFDGKLNRNSLKSFLSQHALKISEKTDHNYTSKNQEKKSKQVKYIESDEEIKLHCFDTSFNCVFAITDEENKKETMEVFKHLKDQKEKYQFLLIHSSKAKDIVELLQLSVDYPSLFVLNPMKKVYRNYAGVFDRKSIQVWLERIESGAIDVWPFSGDIKLTTKKYHDEL